MSTGLRPLVGLGHSTTAIAVVITLALTALPTSRAEAMQDLAGATLDRIAVSADTVGIGDRFQLTVELTLPPGTVAYLPDSLESSAFESLDVFQWQVEASTRGPRLRITYPLIAFQVGTIVTPEFEIFIAPEAVSVAAGGSAPGDVVGSWSVLLENPSALAGSRLLSAPTRELWVASVLMLDDITQGLEPRPVADVTGGNLNWVATLLFLAFVLTLASVSFSLGRDWLASRRLEPVAPPDPKAEALTALDHLLATKLHTRGEQRTFFGRSSDIVRRYVEGYDAAWSRAHTSTELMGDLRRRVEDAQAEPLAHEMHVAEAVKFGGDRPDAPKAEGHWRAVRDWVAESEAPE